ncbi:hypothetical protein AFCDBAGC_3354 [Methylobacterium cerastii]|uniref:Uncharacterized protein n=1 Tax=Methylobacterium cerastii TaxID=932741 RepID=A0ABQ4QJP8_9HYPH|nr:hypothetical protein [Methylobacterium cerastii]GJD45481.1 hypothetical protein AFCDBAGC_3354 [Methylobacterium cerastii]
MARINIRTTTIRSEEMALPAFASAVVDEEDHEGYPFARSSGMAIMSDGSSLEISVAGHRPYAGFGGTEFTDAEITISYEKVALAEGNFRTGPAASAGFAQVLAVLEGIVAKVRAEMGEA